MSESIESQTLYFLRPGPKNTAALLEAAARRFKELGLEKVIIASRSGRTIEGALEYFDPQACHLIAVTYVTGARKPNEQEMPDEVRAGLAAKGVKFITAAHAFGSIGRGIRNKLNTYQIDEIMAHTLRMFGQGVKVGVEIAYMAADCGFVRTDEDVLTIGGSGKGADTAMIVQPSNTHNCLDLKVREIIAKPWQP